jgi:glycosyltransferase involved in cell wall biosynthesis
MGRALGASIRAFDVVHLHSVFLWPTWAAARAATKAGVPYLLSPRGMLVGALLRRKSRVAKSLWINLVERPNLKNAAAIHVTSGIEGEELLKLGLPVRRIVDVPNGVEMPSDRASGKPWHPSAVAVAVRPYVLCLGRVSWKKGLDQLILAMVNVRNAELVIAGNDEENYQPKLEAIARKNGIADRVHFLGPVHGEEKWAIIRSAAVFALPSYSENFGNAVLEAMACGIPVVVTPEVGLAAAVRDIGAGLVVKSGASALAGSIVSLLENAELRKRMGEAGRRSVQEMFSWSAIAQRMETVYDQCRMERTLGA